MITRIFFIVACSLLVVRSNAQTADPGFAVVELFTSEGCSTCPPADKLLSEISAEAKLTGKKIYTLSYHVDYWNRYGWKDPFSKNQFTYRQENYSRVFTEKTLYTPQMIINGRDEFTGSNKERANGGIKTALASPSLLKISAVADSVANDTLVISYMCSMTDKNYVLHVAVTENGMSQQVTGGENKGKFLRHEGVVRTFYSVDNCRNKGIVKVPLHGLLLSERVSVICFVQQKKTMQILGATSVAFAH